MPCNQSHLHSSPLEPGRLRELLQRATAPARAEGKLPVVSYEELIRPHYYSAPKQTRLPEAIRTMAGQVRVVIVARYQLKLIKSLYVHKANVAITCR